MYKPLKHHLARLLVVVSLLGLAPVIPAGAAQAATTATQTQIAAVGTYAAKAAQKKIGWSFRTYTSVGLARYAYDYVGITLPTTSSGIASKYTKVSRSSLRAGDLILFNTGKAGVYQVGISLGGNEFITSVESSGVVKRSFAWSHYSKNFRSAHRVPVSARQARVAGVLNTARSLLGKPYQVGAEWENNRAFDCSSYTQYVFAKNGVRLPRTEDGQVKYGTWVSRSKLQPGDLVFFDRDPSPTNITHVGIYIGHGKIIDAANKTRGVAYSSLSWTWYDEGYHTSRRIFQ